MSELEIQFATRGGLYLIIHAIAWVCVIFLVDFFWGDKAVQYVLIAFVIVNSILAVWFSKARKRYEALQNQASSTSN